MMVLGIAATAGGAGALAVNEKRLGSSDLETVTTATTNIPKAHAAGGVLISTGIVLTVTGIVLAAITDNRNVAIGPRGIEFAF